jgi:flagellar biosynthesis/type III secretory pathway protein FliH
VEPTLFNPESQFQAPQRLSAWDAFPTPSSAFASEAWEQAPRMDPRDLGFRQQDLDEDNRVHDSDEGFEPHTYVDLGKLDFAQTVHTPWNAQPATPPVQAAAEHAAQPEDHEASGEEAPIAELTSTDAVDADVDAATAAATDASLDAEATDTPDPATEAGPADPVNEQAWLERLEREVQAAREQATEQARAEGHEAGLAAGRQAAWDEAFAQGREAGLTEGRELGHQAGWTEGHAQGATEAREQAQQAFDAQLAQACEQAVAQALNEQSQSLTAQAAERDAEIRALMTQVGEQLAKALEDTTAWSQALKRLAVHVAEQLVLAELSVSPQAIQRLIERCMGELDLPHAGLVTVSLSPHDHDLIKSQPDLSWTGIDILPDPQLSPGSVKVSCKDTRVSDLIEHRLEPMARQLLVAVDEWQSQSAFKPNALGGRHAGRGGANAGAASLSSSPLSVSSRVIDASDGGVDHG